MNMVLTLAVNATSVLILLKHKDGDANVRSVWLCSFFFFFFFFCDGGVWGAATGWPDLLVAAILASLFLNSASKILRQAADESR